MKKGGFQVHAGRDVAAAQRRRELGVIHVAAKSLGWSDDDYRFHLRQQTGMSSAADLDEAGRRKMLAHLASCGFVPKVAPFKPFDQTAKIQWLWRKLKTTGVLNDASELALRSFIDRTTGLALSDVRFLPPQEAGKVIEALKAWLHRAQRGAA